MPSRIKALPASLYRGPGDTGTTHRVQFGDPSGPLRAKAARDKAKFQRRAAIARAAMRGKP